MTPEQERAEARRALELYESVQGDTDDDTETMIANIYKMKPLQVNAPTWLRNSLDREEQLIAENEQIHNMLTEQIESREKSHLRSVEQDKEIQRLREALISERDEAMKWDGVGTVNRINKTLNQS